MEYIYSDYQPINSKEGYDKIYDITSIKNSLLNLFLVQKGEVPGKPNVGNPLNVQVFDLMDDFTEVTLETAIRNTIDTYEPRVNVENVSIQIYEDLNRIIVAIAFTTNIDNRILGDTIYIPFAHNTKTYIPLRPNL
ncbi:MAG: hypothetical protein DRI86_05625 [Bacteroidetes bacterium]|nr:MAG: hypothetical protein DRI86_05625 [Bacteroidota bacterium]